MIPAVILRCKKQHDKVNRLVQYCRELDGTELTVLDIPEEIDVIPHPLGVEHAIRWAAKLFNEPWLYLEADSIPIQPEWIKTITRAYYEAGKPYMLPSLEGCDPCDIASAIGVYPADTSERLGPAPSRPPYFDSVIYRQQKNDVHFTKLIQHVYGIYQNNHLARRIDFPRDIKILRNDAVIFHSDVTQSIIRGGLLQSFYHSGDLGDIIAALPIIRQRGGGHLLIGPHHHHINGRKPRVEMDRKRFELIEPLLSQQKFLKSVQWCDDYHKADFDFSTFRNNGWNRKDNLAEWQGRHVGRLDLSMEPWLTVEAEWTGRVVISRSPRYINPDFPWKKICETYGERILFVGLPEEHQLLQTKFGVTVECAETNNLLEVAEVLSGAELQFSNQSVPWWIGAGLGKRVIQESCLPIPNSIINQESLMYSRNPEELKAIHDFLDSYEPPLEPMAVEEGLEYAI